MNSIESAIHSSYLITTLYVTPAHQLVVLFGHGIIYILSKQWQTGIKPSEKHHKIDVGNQRENNKILLISYD
jgi:hypothetical protein